MTENAVLDEFHPQVAEHLARLRSSLVEGYSLKSLAAWIERHTYLRAAPFSFHGHEFQRRIIEDPATEQVVRKCSQIGLSEMSVRLALAMANVMPGFTVIYTLPTAAFSSTFARTRVDPVIQGSPHLLGRIHPTVNSGEVKQFDQSFLYFRGTKGVSAAISVPADCIIHDELDFSDVEVLSNYQSRLTHSPYKLKKKFSTPTVEGWGISAEFEASRQKWQMVKCNHCAEWFLPDYFKHVVVPGWNKELREIQRDNIHLTRYKEAYLACPKCGREPDLGLDHRAWVVANPDTANDTSGWQIQPFDAPTIITIPDLVKASTTYERYADFINFNLGLPAEDKETSFSREELERLFVRAPRFTPYAHVMGVDIGHDCHTFVAALGPEGKIDIVHAEKVPVGLLDLRKAELKAKFSVRVGVMDSQPFFDLLMRLQERDRNLFGAVYSSSKDLDVYATTIREADPEKGRPEMRQVDINRNKLFDVIMDFVRSGNLAIVDCEQRDIIIEHMLDMKRVKDFNHDNELVFAWKKSAKGHDHWHHTLAYAYVAARLVSTAQGGTPLPMSVGKIRLKKPVA